MNDAERERRIQVMKQQVKQETATAVENIQQITRMISNGTGAMIYKAITGKK